MTHTVCGVLQQDELRWPVPFSQCLREHFAVFQEPPSRDSKVGTSFGWTESSKTQSGEKGAGQN